MCYTCERASDSNDVKISTIFRNGRWVSCGPHAPSPPPHPPTNPPKTVFFWWLRIKGNNSPPSVPDGGEFFLKFKNIYKPATPPPLSHLAVHKILEPRNRQSQTRHKILETRGWTRHKFLEPRGWRLDARVGGEDLGRGWGRGRMARVNI